jgi:hypothetical protein
MIRSRYRPRLFGRELSSWGFRTRFSPKPFRLCILQSVQVATAADRVQFGAGKPPVAIFDEPNARAIRNCEQTQRCIDARAEESATSLPWGTPISLQLLFDPT